MTLGKVTEKLLEAYEGEKPNFKNHKSVCYKGREYAVGKAKGCKRLSISKLVHEVTKECFGKNKENLSTKAGEKLKNIFTHIKDRKEKKRSRICLVRFCIDFFEKLSNWKQENGFITSSQAIQNLLSKIETIKADDIDTDPIDVPPETEDDDLPHTFEGELRRALRKNIKEFPLVIEDLIVSYRPEVELLDNLIND